MSDKLKYNLADALPVAEWLKALLVPCCETI